MTKKSTSAAKLSLSISFPPFENPKGQAFLSQNRQFQWTNTGNCIYPVVLASAATVLNLSGHQVFWDDAIAEHLSFTSWYRRLIQRKPSLIVFETKTPVVKFHWKLIKKIKSHRNQKWQPIIILLGDHVSALPEESLRKSPVDYVLTGGDYDFLLPNLVSHLEDNTPLQPGFYFRQKQKIINTGTFIHTDHHLDSLPLIDRKLTHWQLYATNNTNYQQLPGTYIMSGRDCWWGKCTFCSWTTLYPAGNYRHHSVDYIINDLKHLANDLHIKNIFDDAGSIATGPWLDELCHQLIATKLNQKITLGCNVRFGSITPTQYQLMKKAGFRFLLYGLESANQNTLNHINKNLDVSQVIPDLKAAKSAGLKPHITLMLGYPWETRDDINNTVNFVTQIFKLNLADSLQATLVIPYPGTPLFTYCQENQLFRTKNWDNFDMKQSVIKTPISPKDLNQAIRRLFKAVLTPNFLFHQILSIRSWSDFQRLFSYSNKFILKLKDFSSDK